MLRTWPLNNCQIFIYLEHWGHIFSQTHVFWCCSLGKPILPMNTEPKNVFNQRSHPGHRYTKTTTIMPFSFHWSGLKFVDMNVFLHQACVPGPLGISSASTFIKIPPGPHHSLNLESKQFYLSVLDTKLCHRHMTSWV